MTDLHMMMLEARIRMLAAIKALPTDNEQCLLVKELAVEFDAADREYTQALKSQAANLLGEWHTATGDLT